MHFIRSLEYKEIYKIMTGREANTALPRLEWRFLLEKMANRAPYLYRRPFNQLNGEAVYSMYIIPTHYRTNTTGPRTSETVNQRTAFVDLFIEIDSSWLDKHSIFDFPTKGIIDTNVLATLNSGVTEFMMTTNLFDMVIENAYIIDTGISDYAPETAEFLLPIMRCAIDPKDTSPDFEATRDSIMKATDTVLDLGIRNKAGLYACSLNYRSYTINEVIERAWLKDHGSEEKEWGIHDDLACRFERDPSYEEWCAHCRNCYNRLVANMCRTYVDVVRMTKYLQYDFGIDGIVE